MSPPPKDEAQPRILPLVDIQEAYQAREKIKTKKEEFQSLAFQLLNDIENSRKQTLSLINERLTSFEWFIIFCLTILIDLSLLAINDKSAFSIFLITALSLVVSLLVLLIYHLDDLTWKENERIFEPYQQTFEEMGFLRYYPDGLIELKRAKVPKNKPYRVVTYLDPYPDMKRKKITIIRPLNKQ